MIPAIESKSVEEEDKLHLSFYNFLSSCNKDATLRSELRKNLKVTVTQIQFSYSKGKDCVEAKFIARWVGEIQKLQSCLKNDSFSCWLADYVNSIGLGVELDGNYAKKIRIVAYEIKKEDNPESR